MYRTLNPWLLKYKGLTVHDCWAQCEIWLLQGICLYRDQWKCCQSYWQFFLTFTVCRSSSYPFCLVSYYIKWVTLLGHISFAKFNFPSTMNHVQNQTKTKLMDWLSNIAIIVYNFLQKGLPKNCFQAYIFFSLNNSIIDSLVFFF